MKRSMVALAAAAACSSGMAQVPPPTPGVVLYGGVDGNVTRASATGRGSLWQVRDGGMYVTKIGFTGREDLGGGYSASFVMEGQASSDTGTSATTNTNNTPAGTTAAGGHTWNRKSTVSLHTPLGEVRFGRDYTSTFVPTTYMDPFFSAGVASAVNFQVFYTQTTLMPTLVRASNMVGYYIPPTWVPGLYAYAQVAAGEGSGARYTGAGTGYRRGPLLVSGAYGVTKGPLQGSSGLSASTVAADNNLKVWSLGASYAFGGFKPMFFYQRQVMDRFGPTAGPVELDRTVDDWLVGFSWAIGVNTIKASYQEKNDKGISNVDPKQIGLGYSYHLSKRTALYANAVQIKNNNGGSWSFLASGFAPTANGTSRAIQAGLSHNF
ncbi:MAG TPA: porin [Rhizobacter sp.]